MDGNGRWATRRGLPRVAGPSRRAARGAAALWSTRPMWASDRLTLYAFSSDNWRRPPAEVQQHLLAATGVSAHWKRRRMRERGARLQVIGRRDRLPTRCCARSRRPNGRRPRGDGFSCAWRLIIRRATQSCARRRRRWQPCLTRMSSRCRICCGRSSCDSSDRGERAKSIC